MLEYTQFAILAIIIGGMVTFQLLFAPMVFIKLDNEVARPFIRKFFPFYYLYFAALSLLLTISAYFLFGQKHDIALIILYAFTCLGFVISRQIFMPLANKATDEKRQKDFDRYHRMTVAINTLQLVLMLIALWLLV